jgi:hypothetical protein
LFEKLHELEPNNAENKFWIETASEKLKRR